eukprot:gb/GFBE01068443.1/.p1 GENE.gb/GFBE01068443.1/~~gb/GFBE01068443.1/.p1  ORF type:complete len:138 (+),score=31.46 gb/GFBE01068443.1/:1-414(+)
MKTMQVAVTGISKRLLAFESSVEARLGRLEDNLENNQRLLMAKLDANLFARGKDYPRVNVREASNEGNDKSLPRAQTVKKIHGKKTCSSEELRQTAHVRMISIGSTSTDVGPTPPTDPSESPVAPAYPAEHLPGMCG